MDTWCSRTGSAVASFVTSWRDAAIDAGPDPGHRRRRLRRRPPARAARAPTTSSSWPGTALAPRRPSICPRRNGNPSTCSIGRPYARRSRALRPATVYHCAGAAHVGRSWEAVESTFAINVRGTHHLVEGLRETGVDARVLIPGSAMVYAPSSERIREDHPTIPDSPYGLSKLAQELVGSGNPGGPAVFIARAFNHLGARQDPAFAASGFARRIADIEAGRCPPEIAVGNLDARRDLTDVRDTVRAYRLIVEHGTPGRAYNVCTGRAVSIRDLLDMLLARARVPIQVTVDPARYRPADLPLVVGDPRPDSAGARLDRRHPPRTDAGRSAGVLAPRAVSRTRETLLAGAAIVALTLFVTWPQAVHLGTRVAVHDDSYFSMWRLAWIAHALATDPRHLFDANIFHPARGIARLLGRHAGSRAWSGPRSFGRRPRRFSSTTSSCSAGIAASGLAMFVLARHVIGAMAPALVAAAIFTMAPYRIEHFMHLELQWTMWMPLTLWAFHRAIDEGAWRWGVLGGVFLWLQVMSSRVLRRVSRHRQRPCSWCCCWRALLVERGRPCRASSGARLSRSC